jgi:hypothetical protein
VKNYGLASVHQFLGDFIVYRNLNPMDERLPPLARLRRELDLPEGIIPRKSEPAYARVIAQLLRRARALDAPGLSVERLVYVGDTRLNDGTAFANVCRAANWPGQAFIAAERNKEPARMEVTGAIYAANRWSMLRDFALEVRADERTAVIFDLDKTTLGARGRNDGVIDRARLAAVRRTVGGLLGGSFDAGGFETAYHRFNEPEFHSFTADNQDYLAYVCLILGSGLYALAALEADVRAGRMSGFGQFIAAVDDRAADLPADLRDIHESVLARVEQGDPTPFKAFRHNEYRATVERLGCLPDDAPVETMLAEEIVVTQEVRETALAWRAEGALLFGLSDKPDEASVPGVALLAQGYRPIHRIRTHAVGAQEGEV